MRRLLRRDEGGSLAPAVPVIAFMLLVLGGLGIDGSRQLNARGEAVAYAEEASRAGAQAVDTSSPDLKLLPQSEVEKRVNAYCAVVLKLGPVTDCGFKKIDAVSASDPRQIVVVTEVKTKIKTTLLGLVGFRELTAQGIAKARPYRGIDTAEN